MSLDSKIFGSTSNNGVEADVGGHLKTTTSLDPRYMGGSRQFNENDTGSITGNPWLHSSEVDTDFRLRVSQDIILDEEVFNYVAQNTGKHSHATTTMTSSWAAGQFTTNSTSIATTNTGVQLLTYATFPTTGTQTLSADMIVGFSAQPNVNTFVEFGFMQATSTTAPPTDGCFFRLSSAGLQGILSNNGTETSTGVFPLSGGTGTWAYTNNKRYQFICYLGGVAAYFWVNNGASTELLGSIPLPAAQHRLVMAAGVQIGLKHRIIGGTAGSVFQVQLGSYNVRLGGSNLSTTPCTQGNRIYGSYQGQSGGTMGSLANYVNSTNPTAAVPTNTTAALGVGLGGQFWETVSLAVNTDGIICSYQVPAVSLNGTSRRLVICGVYLTSYVQMVVAGAPYVAQYSLAWGHTAVSLATAESSTAKAPRRISLPFTQLVTANQAVSTLIQQPSTFCDLGEAPIFVNAGEFIQLVTKHVGTAGTTGVVAHNVTFVYGWE